MKKNRLPVWVIPVILLIGLGLLITGIVSLFVASQSSARDLPVSSPTRVAVSTATSQAVPSPTFTSLPPPTATKAQTLPTLTPTSTPAPTKPPAPSPLPDLAFDGSTAYQHVLAQAAIGPRPVGSEAGWATGDFIISELDKLDWPTESQEFIFKGIKGRNVIAKMGSGPVIIIGAHYDTRPAADQDPDPALRDTWIEGANDGASGVAVLLELARVLEPEKLQNEVWLAFFDAEDRGRLDGWPFSVGARYMAENLTVNPQAMVLLDMIGDADQQLYYERNSTLELSQEIWAVAAKLGYQDRFIPEFRHTIIDDHLPFLERAIPAIDIIDFDYPYWHTVEDTADKVSPESLESVGHTLEVWLEEKQ